MTNAEIVELLPKMKPRALSLGECFVLELFKVPRGRGLTAAYERINEVVGDLYGTRNTYAKLQYAESFAQLSSKDRLRAWILMAVLGMNPEDFGANDSVVPPTIDIVELRNALHIVPPTGVEPATYGTNVRWLDRRDASRPARDRDRVAPVTSIHSKRVS